jgi:hypothetical protein
LKRRSNIGQRWAIAETGEYRKCAVQTGVFLQKFACTVGALPKGMQMGDASRFIPVWM